MSVETLFNALWNQYVALNPAVGDIHHLFSERESRVFNDHIALRTFQHPKVGIDKLAKAFEDLGYERKANYTFTQKKLNAIHLQHKDDLDLPLVFISELKLKECSILLNDIVTKEIIDKIDYHIPDSPAFCYSGRTWGAISFDLYEQLREESEYAAWMYVYGYMANHFTVKVNTLTSLHSLEAVNAFLEEHGYQLNDAGGKIKGSPELLLEQSSTLAEKRPVEFIEGTKEIPSCFYEFARRYLYPDGKEFLGFIEGNADKIFESTNMS